VGRDLPPIDVQKIEAGPPKKLLPPFHYRWFCPARQLGTPSPRSLPAASPRRRRESFETEDVATLARISLVPWFLVEPAIIRNLIEPGLKQ
jgi:hypothetical protein